MQLLFPHESIRESQKELIEEITKSIQNKSHLIAHAPTGIGKTAAVLCPAISHALENNLTVIFVTPKHTQHKIAVDTIRAIKEKHNLNFTAVDLIGRRNMCAQSGVISMTQSEFADYCKEMIEEKMCDYYNNIRDKNKLSLQTELLLREINSKVLHVEELKEISSKNKLCPYELAIILSISAKVIIADYHHLLNTSIRETLLNKMQKDLSELIIIFDEAHSIPERCRELLSSQVSTITAELAAKEARSLKYEEMAEDILKIKESLEKLSREKTTIETSESLIKKEEFMELIKDYDELTENVLFIAEETKDIKKKSFAKSVYSFLINWQGPDEAFTRILKKGFTEKGNPIITLSYKCLDPSLIISPLVEESYSTIFMSGTLTPIDMYKDLFNIQAKCIGLKNPFPKQNRLDIIIPETTTKYTARSPEMYERIAQYCASITNLVPGNTAIFFPSYKIRDDINMHFKDLCNKTTFLEQQRLSKEEKTELIEKFKQYEKTGAVLLAASAGSFGEGIDFPRNVLKCIIIVGIPLDKPDLESQELIKYYDKKFGKGWDYGYIMPALIKCFQNAGRCIRSETDKGVIIFLDQRYTWDSYFKCFPKDSYLRITKEPLPRIKEFFDNHNLTQ